MMDQATRNRMMASINEHIKTCLVCKTKFASVKKFSPRLVKVLNEILDCIERRIDKEEAMRKEAKR
jgi:hypothetical protein